MVLNRWNLSFGGGPARIRTGDRQVSLLGAMSLPLCQSPLQRNLAELRALHRARAVFEF
jgi:hypothetical protein